MHPALIKPMVNELMPFPQVSQSCGRVRRFTTKQNREASPKLDAEASISSYLFLLAQMFQGLAHWRTGNFDHAVQRVAHFQDHKNCPRDGQGTDEEHGDDSGVAGS